ncbi:MAG: HU family DNA-binding protein [Parabacteroides distasonis]|nr:HU family DNA-binding protein [Parabacteroides distasonis]
MNKNLLIKQIADRLAKRKEEVQPIVESFLDCVTESLQKNETVTIRGFGTFRIRRQTARPVRNVKTGEPCMLVPRNSVKFVVGSDLFDKINEK